MKYSDFVGEVQNRLELPSQAHAVRATRAVLTTLGSRLYPGEAEDLVGALPMEIDYYVKQSLPGQSFSRDEFIRRVAEIEEIDEADAFRHIQVVLDITGEAIPGGELQDIYQGLPEEFDDFFELADLQQVEA